jgi:UDP-N-acetylmuramate-alanine ligase
MLRDALIERGVHAQSFHTLEAVALEAKETVGSNDVVLCVGAGSVTKVSELLTN